MYITIYMHIYKHMYVYYYIYIYTNICMYITIYTYIQTYVCILLYIYIYTNICMYIIIYIHIYKHMYVYYYFLLYFYWNLIFIKITFIKYYILIFISYLIWIYIITMSNLQPLQVSSPLSHLPCQRSPAPLLPVNRLHRWFPSKQRLRLLAPLAPLSGLVPNRELKCRAFDRRSRLGSRKLKILALCWQLSMKLIWGYLEARVLEFCKANQIFILSIFSPFFKIILH